MGNLYVKLGEEAMMTKSELRNQTDQIIEKLPEETSWEDLMYRIYVRKKIEKGLADSEAGRLYSTEDIRKELGLV